MSDLAPMREQVYTDPRPKEYFDRFHERARTREPDWVYELVRVITSLYAYTFLRARSISSENVPGSGAVILAPNHFSFMDHFLMGCFIRRKVRFMAKSQLFKGPMQFIYTHGGVFPVRRGARDEEMFITAEAILARGGAITMYCEGGRSRTGKVAEQAKRGIGRLALETGVPGRADRDLRLLARAQLEAPAVPARSPCSTASRCAGSASRTRRASSSRPSPTRSSVEIRTLYAGLRGARRKGILRRLRAERRTREERRRRLSGRLGVALHMSERLDVGGVIRRVFDIYVDQAPVLLPASAVVFVITGHRHGAARRRRARARAAGAAAQPRRRRRCSRGWSSSSWPTCRTGGATTAPASCCARPRPCSGS